MIRSISKILSVVLAFFITSLAELSYFSDYYYAASSAAFVVISVLVTLLAVMTKSRSLIIYAAVYAVGSFLYAFMMNYSFAFILFDIIYGGAINYSLLVIIADSFIIVLGGVNVIYRLYTLRYYGSSGDDIFDARVDLHKWAR